MPAGHAFIGQPETNLKQPGLLIKPRGKKKEKKDKSDAALPAAAVRGRGGGWGRALPVFPAAAGPPAARTYSGRRPAPLRSRLPEIPRGLGHNNPFRNQQL